MWENEKEKNSAKRKLSSRVKGGTGVEKMGVRKTKSELAREKKKEAIPCIGKEVPYHLVPSKKDKE